MPDNLPGIIETLTGNRKMVFGIISLALAFLLALTAVYMQTSTYSKEGVLSSDKSKMIEKPSINSQGEIHLNHTRVASDSESVEVVLLGGDKQVLNSVSLDPGQSVILEINSETDYFRKGTDLGKISYKYSITYSYQPYRVLSIPAAILTVIGVVSIYRGFDQFVTGFAESKREESEGKEESDDEEVGVDFMGIGKHREDDEK